MRFLVGLISIYTWARTNRIPLAIERGEPVHLIAMALLFTIQILFLNAGVHHTLAGHSSVLINTFPFFVALLAHFFVPGDRISGRKVLGLILAFSGVFSVFQGTWEETRGSDHLLGDLFVLISGFLLGAKAVYTKRLLAYINPYKLLVWQMLFSLIPFFAISAAAEGISSYHFSTRVVGAILYQGFFVAGFCFVTWTLLLKRHSPSKLSVFFFATPLFGVGLSHLFLSEEVVPGLALGMTLVALGIYIVNRA